MARKKDRTDMPHRSAQERSKDFEEVSLGYSKEMALEEAQRCLQCKTPTCEQGCPVGIGIKDFIKHMQTEDLNKASESLEKSNTLSAVCGRVCPQETQCESKCILAKKGQPIAIGRLERYLGDYSMKKKQHSKSKLH
ncbi:hypothetical protein MFMK1_002899 [Metallumcola ferriviriculae]|uniref:Dihydroprymidine dehydrogenase domain-containing protein n=1 Tax=Metallumcola ferriviriculae TaxID=3039180 RepID=A0AAU0UUV0_9FIRM|nr:hypothetical protein MFMK1_002899 [Desulfitibacteraceae bacterium MK1]